MRRIGVVTVGRSDYGIYRPVLRAIQAEPTLRLHLLVSGAHLSEDFGSTVKAIEADGFPVAERIEVRPASDTPEGIADSLGRGVSGFARAYARGRPDLLLVAGDRFEMYAAVVAALPFTIPVAHLHGGELTEGAMDDALRHSMTKLSHLHFVATEAYARRVRQLGEEPWRIVVSGAPGLDHVPTTPVWPRAELAERLGAPAAGPFLLVTYHPVTLEYERTGQQVEELLAALRAAGVPVLFTLPNADTHGAVIRGQLQQFLRQTPTARLVMNAGTQGYFSLMTHAAAMVGNSSSGLVEAPSFGLPVVNVGTRQRGRLRAGNVIDVGNGRDEIAAGIRRAVAPAFRASLAGLVNPYGTGQASARIVRRLRTVELNEHLIMKRFVDAPSVPEAAAAPSVVAHAS